MNPDRLEEFNQLITRVRNNDPSLTTLSLSSFGLTDQDAILIADALKNNNKVTELDVSSNNIWAVGAAALASNQTLTSLNVSYNNIGDAGAAALVNNITLTSLNVSYGNIGAEALDIRDRFAQIHKKVAEHLVNFTMAIIQQKNVSDAEELFNLDLSREEIELFLSQSEKRSKSAELIKRELVDHLNENDGFVFRLKNASIDNDKNSPKTLQYLALSKTFDNVFSSFVNKLEEKLAPAIEAQPINAPTIKNSSETTSLQNGTVTVVATQLANNR